MLPFANVARRKAKQIARKVVFGSVAGVCFFIGAGFLLAAAWSALAVAKGPVFASLVIGLVLVGLGLILLAVALSRPRSLGEELRDERIAAQNRAALTGQSDLERTISGLLSEIGLPPPRGGTGAMPGLAAAFVYGLTLSVAASRRRGRRHVVRRRR